MDTSILSSLLEERQRDLGISNRKMAKRVGISHTTLNRIYEGEAISLTTAQKVADYLDTDVSSLLSLDRDEQLQAVANVVATMIAQEPQLTKIFLEAHSKLKRGEISPEILKEIAAFAAFRLNAS